MEAFLEILKEINIVQIVIIFAGMWFFYNRLDNKINRLEQRIDDVEKKLETVQDKLMTRIDNLYNLFAGFLCSKKDDKAA